MKKTINENEEYLRYALDRLIYINGKVKQHPTDDFWQRQLELHEEYCFKLTQKGEIK